MRREAEAISDSELDRRLTVVPTGDELASLGRSLNRMLDRLEVAVERERRLVDDASHELRTPLANLQAELDLALRRARSEPELLAALRSAADETDRLSRLAADLLVLARAHRGQLPIDRRDVDLAGLVESSIGRFDRRAGDGDVLLEARTEAALRGRLDAVRLGQALDNVIENALRHTPRGGRVVIEARRDGDAIVVSVTDSGSGFTPGLLDEAFEPFRRADEGRARADGGAGLGLAITRAVARAHGGDVAAWNGPSGGAVVELRFPA
jgi:signal transduction histidine kinase